MARRPNTNLREFLLRNIAAHPRDIAAVASLKFGMTRQVVNRALAALVRDGVIEASGQTSGRVYNLPVRTELENFPVRGAQEHRIWSDWVRPRLGDLKPNVIGICEYAVTEMINNAVDHSEGTTITIALEQTASSTTVRIIDDGVGLFTKIRNAFHLEDEQHAALELVKGKLTTDPARHSGEGIFFTSRAVDDFIADSGNIWFHHSAPDGDWLIDFVGSPPGTMITLTLDAFGTRHLSDIFDKFTAHQDDYKFDVTHIPVGLAQVGEDNLVSRSQAKRFTARFDRFRRVILDFQDVNTIGQAFADEVFRVYAIGHPNVEIVAIRANAEVTRMINRAIGARSGGGG